MRLDQEPSARVKSPGSDVIEWMRRAAQAFNDLYDRFVRIESTAWRVLEDWVPTAVATKVFSLPAGYSAFRLTVSGVTVSAGTTTNDLYARFSIGGVVRSGASDYANQGANWYGAVAAIISAVASFFPLTTNGNFATGTAIPSDVTAQINPGSAAVRASMLVNSRSCGNSGARVLTITSTELGLLGRIDQLTIGWASSGTFTAGQGAIVLEALPA